MYLPPIQNIEQITKDPTLLGIKPWWIILLGAAILYLDPAQIVLKLPRLDAAIERLASFIPSIARWVELSPFPVNTKLFFVFIWAMIPLQCYWLITSDKVRRSYQEGYLAKSAQQTLAIRIVGLFCFSMVFGVITFITFYWAIVDTPPCSVCVNTVRWAQLFIGCLVSMTISMGIGVASRTIA